jgi:hypothetical protein
MEKKFDAVDFQRKIREELGRKYLSNRKVFLQELKKVSSKTGNRQKAIGVSKS